MLLSITAATNGQAYSPRWLYVRERNGVAAMLALVDVYFRDATTDKIGVESD